MLEVALTRYDGHIYAVLGAEGAGCGYHLVSPPDIPAKKKPYPSAAHARLALIRAAAKDEAMRERPLRENATWRQFPAVIPKGKEILVLDSDGAVTRARVIDAQRGDVVLAQGKRLSNSDSFWWSTPL